MVKKHGLMGLFEKKSTILMALAFSVLGLLGLEMMIYIASASSAGEYSIVEVKDRRGNVVYYTPGTDASHVDRTFFGRQFGNLDNYDVEVKRVSKPFPVRAWVAASVGVPIVLMLLIAYLVKVYLALLHDGEAHGAAAPGEENLPALYRKSHPFMSWAMFLSSHSIFYLGAAIGILCLVFWMVPNLLADLFHTSLSAVKESKWLILGPVALFTLLAIWVIYLRYRLSRKMMDHQLTLEKYRLDREIALRSSWPGEIAERKNRELEA